MPSAHERPPAAPEPEPALHTEPQIEDRRRFLKLAGAASAGLASFFVGILSLRTFLSPMFRRATEQNWIKVAEADQVKLGKWMKVSFVEDVNDAWVESRVLRNAWLRTPDGEHFTALNGSCTHLGCAFALDEERKVFACPCHHGVFDLKTGAVLSGPPPRALDPIPVRVVDGDVQVMYKQFRAGIAERITV